MKILKKKKKKKKKKPLSGWEKDSWALGYCLCGPMALALVV